MIIYEVKVDGLYELQMDLSVLKDRSKFVLRGAINKTANDVQKRLIEETAKRYVNKGGKAAIKSTFDPIKKAKVGNLVATIRTHGPIQEPKDFRLNPEAYTPRNRPKRGHSLKVLKSSRAKVVQLRPGARDAYKAFVVKYGTDHIGLAQRMPGTHMKDKPHKEAIKSLYSPSVPIMVGGDHGAFELLEPDIYNILAEHVRAEIERLIG